MVSDQRRRSIDEKKRLVFSFYDIHRILKEQCHRPAGSYSIKESCIAVTIRFSLHIILNKFCLLIYLFYQCFFSK